MLDRKSSDCWDRGIGHCYGWFKIVFEMGSFCLGLTVGVVAQTMKHLVIAHFLISTEPLQVLALVLGSVLANQ